MLCLIVLLMTGTYEEKTGRTAAAPGFRISDSWSCSPLHCARLSIMLHLTRRQPHDDRSLARKAASKKHPQRLVFCVEDHEAMSGMQVAYESSMRPRHSVLVTECELLPSSHESVTVSVSHMRHHESGACREIGRRVSVSLIHWTHDSISQLYHLLAVRVGEVGRRMSYHSV